MVRTLNHKKIKEMCGEVSFKRGESFFRANKVIFKKFNIHESFAIVKGTEDFEVSIKSNDKDMLQTSCSCPSLASYHRDCQHIAAVLIAMCEHLQKGTTPNLNSNLTDYETSNSDLTDGFVKLFNGKKSSRSSRKQRLFETRQIINAEFTLQVIPLQNGSHICGIQVNIGHSKVGNIREFLENVKIGHASEISKSFTYDPNLHCLLRETDDVVQLLVQLMDDEKSFLEHIHDQTFTKNHHDTLFIPTTSWEQLVNSLLHVPIVKLVTQDKSYYELHIASHLLPLQFDIIEANKKDFQLNVYGLEDVILLNSYSYVLTKGKFYRLKSEDFIRLTDLKEMLHISGTTIIPIPTKQIKFFMDTVIPGLKRLGEVQISEAFLRQFDRPPLVAKLYLDRVKNRLLAGLDFHYDHILINPLDHRDFINHSNVTRDEEKEYEILQLMEECSFSKTDGGYYLHNEELEYEFLHHKIPKLEKLVQIHATTAVRNRIFRGNTFPKINVKVKKERTNWLEFTFKMDGISENEIREVITALKEKRKYYRLKNGTLFTLETREFAEIQRFLKEVPSQEEDLITGLNLPIVRGLQLIDSEDNPNSFELEKSFHEFLDQIQNPGNIDIQIPDRVKPILRDYQKHGYKWMKTLANYGFGGILADDMGLGKTLQSISYILSILPEVRNKKLPVLVVCPSSLTYNWLSEFYKFAPNIKSVVLDGKKSDRMKLQEDVSTVDVVITSYPLLRKDIKWFEKQTFHTVFFDEAQNFKNPLTQTARAVKKLQANYRFGLTGTPVENSLEELWSIYHVVFPELFQGLKEYSNLTKKTIARRIRPFLLRRMKEDVLKELPEKVEMIESEELLPEQKKLYAAYLAKLRQETLKHLDKDKSFGKTRIRILAGITRLRQICCHPALFIEGYKGSSAKFEQLLQIIEESKHANRRVLIFSQFTKMLEMIGRELSINGDEFFYLDGSTSSEKRLEMCNRFNDGECDFFLISLKAGGVGLNLTGANTVVLYDLWWNPAVEQQAADRAYRIGQKNDVQVIKLVARGTIEEKMNELQSKKKELVEEIIDSDDKVSSTLTEEDIREILMM
ncbi:DEAD/DEAH box helicase [Bacillus sp. OAE603]|uniref:DEAD/DEAH box helicase n=1 Tax=Gottfriedia sp. OAE603 TaxID=2663872 RepID=UPI001789D41A